MRELWGVLGGVASACGKFLLVQTGAPDWVVSCWRWYNSKVHAPSLIYQPTRAVHLLNPREALLFSRRQLAELWFQEIKSPLLHKAARLVLEVCAGWARAASRGWCEETTTETLDPKVSSTLTRIS
jgi:hypothetical protein